MPLTMSPLSATPTRTTGEAFVHVITTTINTTTNGFPRGT